MNFSREAVELSDANRGRAAAGPLARKPALLSAAAVTITSFLAGDKVISAYLINVGR